MAWPAAALVLEVLGYLLIGGPATPDAEGGGGRALGTLMVLSWTSGRDAGDPRRRPGARRRHPDGPTDWMALLRTLRPRYLRE
jgi:hypothetical protein